VRENEATTWYPEHIKHGRYGDWLTNNIDWALSRSRYWGTPLPIWRCPRKHDTCVGSLAELSKLTGTDQSGLDPHRPFVDDVTFGCPQCGEPARRVPEVIDAWFDSGAMPFAQWGYPYAEGSRERFEAAFPADFICEAIDQTRGWFYSLMAVSTAVFDQNSYRNVLCLGHILAEDGRKMSKHLGNILEPIPLMDAHGADAVRWFMAAGGSPWASRRVGHGTIQETVRKVLLTYWNSVSFLALYARTNGWSPVGDAPAVADRPVLDRWLVSVRTELVRDVTDALENFDTQRAGSLISDFVDNLSNWYVRRSRRRFWDGEPAALWTLHETLDVVTRLMAPLAPFITERVWQDLFVAAVPDAPVSVHLASWPTADAAAIDDGLNSAMELTRRLVELGRGARSEARVKTRQPLRRVLVPSSSHARLTHELLAEIAAELNVGVVESFASAGDVVDYSAKGNFRALGKRFGKETPKVAQAIADADAAALASELEAHGGSPLLRDVELPLLRTLATMERAGIAVDADYLARLHATFDAQVRAAEQAAYAVLGRPINLGSPKQLQGVLFDELAMPKTRRTRTGYTTDAEALESLYAKTGHPFLEHLLRHRDQIRLRQTVEGLQKSIADDGRIHTTYLQTIAATGRLSSTDPNLQNIPIRTEDGRRIREAFVVGAGFESLMSVDYSQIEMRIMAHASGDAALIEAFTSGHDFHSATAARVFGVDAGEVTPAQRAKVKAMNYGLAYGLSAFGLAAQLGIPTSEARALMDEYFESFGNARAYLDGLVAQARRTGYTETILGRRRYLPDLTSSNRQRREMAERMALNAPIQGSAADIIKVAMLAVESGLAGSGLRSRMLLQVHDELVFEVAPGERAALEALVRDRMGHAMELTVPLDVSVGVGRSWHEAAH